MQSQAFAVLYTKQLTKKLKTYHDGFLIRDGPGARLLTDAGSELACCRWPPSLELAGTSEGITCFDGYLVDCDGELSGPTEVPRPRPVCITGIPPAVAGGSRAAPGLSPAQRLVTPCVAATGVRGKFKPPRIAAPLPQSTPTLQLEAAQGWYGTNDAQPSLLGKRRQADQQEAPAVGAAYRQAPQAPPVRRSGAVASFRLGSLFL